MSVDREPHHAASPFESEDSERDRLREEVLADPPGMIREGWSYWFRHTGWKLILPALVVAGVVAALLLG